MGWIRPRSLRGLLLIGFGLVAIPLLVAILNATEEMRRISGASSALVTESVAAVDTGDALASAADELKRTAGLYQALHEPDMHEAFIRAHARFVAALDALTSRSKAPAARALAQRIDADAARLDAAFNAATQDGVRPRDADQMLATAIQSYASTDDAIRDLKEAVSRETNAKLEALEASTARTESRLTIEIAALVPITALIIFVFLSVLARPLRQVDRAIGDLGRGALSQPIEVDGPDDLRRLGYQLEWLRERLLELAEERNRFLRHMSHELKTPLANIREGSDLLVDGAVGLLTADQHEISIILRDNSVKLQRIIENLLSFSAWQARAATLEIERFGLRDLIAVVVEAHRLTLVAHRIHLDVTVEALDIEADRIKLQLVLDNLLSNAVKFTPDGGRIGLAARREGAEVVIEVRDSGPGVPPEERSRLFDPFYTGTTISSGKLKGTGIGLSVVREFTAAHDGGVEVHDNPGGGALFRVRLPLATAKTLEGVA